MEVRTMKVSLPALVCIWLSAMTVPTGVVAKAATKMSEEEAKKSSVHKTFSDQKKNLESVSESLKAKAEAMRKNSGGNQQTKTYEPWFGPCALTYTTSSGGSGSMTNYSLSKDNCRKMCEEYKCNKPKCLWYSQNLPITSPSDSVCKQQKKK
jgi:hypothetical protein